jgi:hypothetical protein
MPPPPRQTMQIPSSIETLVMFHQAIRRHIPEYGNLRYLLGFHNHLPASFDVVQPSLNKSSQHCPIFSDISFACTGLKNPWSSASLSSTTRTASFYVTPYKHGPPDLPILPTSSSFRTWTRYLRFNKFKITRHKKLTANSHVTFGARRRTMVLTSTYISVVL